VNAKSSHEVTRRPQDGDLFGGCGGKGRTIAAKCVNPDDSERDVDRPRPQAALAKREDLEGAKIEKFLIK
jgi:hypothetical protein